MPNLVDRIRRRDWMVCIYREKAKAAILFDHTLGIEGILSTLARETIHKAELLVRNIKFVFCELIPAGLCFRRPFTVHARLIRCGDSSAIRQSSPSTSIFSLTTVVCHQREPKRARSSSVSLSPTQAARSLNARPSSPASSTAARTAARTASYFQRGIRVTPSRPSAGVRQATLSSSLRFLGLFQPEYPSKNRQRP